jgi:hypothetical protein
MSATFVAYVDESGDEGFSFTRRSSEWFVVSAIITRKANDLETVKLVDTVRTQLGKPDKKPLHFRDLRHEHRLPFVATIAQAEMKTVSVLVHKPSLRDPETFRAGYRLYFYAVRYLLERVSWYCRDHRTKHDRGDGSAEVIFSNRAGMSYAELRRYLDLLREQPGLSAARIEWEVVKTEQLTAYSPGKRMGLQIADAIASSFYYAVQPSQHGFTEDRYVRMLKPVVYHRQGKHLGYGLKFWPREVEPQLEVEERFGWVRSEYQ